MNQAEREIHIKICAVDKEPRILKCNYEFFIGMLIVFLDQQGLEIERSFKIYKNRGKNHLTAEKIIKLVTPYILNWHPITKERELTFEQSQNLLCKGVYSHGDMIEIQCNNLDNLGEGIEKAIEIAELEADDKTFVADGKYEPEFKMFRVSEQKQKHMKKYTVVSRRRSVITPKYKKFKPDYKFTQLNIIEKNGENIICEGEKSVTRENHGHNSNKKPPPKLYGPIRPCYKKK